jgi:ribosomal-protein-alanine N-acetyltransferase
MTDTVVELAPLRWWHLPQVLELEEELFAPECWSEELFWSELAQRAHRHYLAALDGDRVVGYAGLASGSGDAFVQNIGVTKDYQRHGVGAQLLVALIDEARARGAQMLGLEVRADGDVAQRLYARHGFDAVGRRRGYYQPSNVDAIVMLKELT